MNASETNVGQNSLLASAQTKQILLTSLSLKVSLNLSGFLLLGTHIMSLPASTWPHFKLNLLITYYSVATHTGRYYSFCAELTLFTLGYLCMYLVPILFWRCSALLQEKLQSSHDTNEYQYQNLVWQLMKCSRSDIFNMLWYGYIPDAVPGDRALRVQKWRWHSKLTIPSALSTEHLCNK